MKDIMPAAGNTRPTAIGGASIIRRYSGSALCYLWRRSGFMSGRMISLGVRELNTGKRLSDQR
jgi:hypothetical protein